MTEPRTLAGVRLADRHAPTGRTRHFYGSPDGERTAAPTPVSLRIVQYADGEGFYLFYCDETGRELTDTYHDSIDEAMAQAEFEFNVARDEWLPA